MDHHRKLLQLIRQNANGEGQQPIRTEADDDGAHLYVYDVIDPWFGISAASLVAALGAAGDRTVHLHINSPGGDVFESRAMQSALVAHPAQVIAHIDGLAASAATSLALAADEVRMTEGGMYMIHNSWCLALGNKDELRTTADLLDKVDTSIAADYVRKTGQTSAQVIAWMDAETWFDATEAKARGFVDSVVPNTRASKGSSALAQGSAGRWNLSAYKRPPQLAKPDAATAVDDAAIAAQQQINRNRLRLLTPA